MRGELQSRTETNKQKTGITKFRRKFAFSIVEKQEAFTSLSEAEIFLSTGKNLILNNSNALGNILDPLLSVHKLRLPFQLKHTIDST